MASLPSSMGSTFAERAAAARGEEYDPPAVDKTEPVENSTFATRSGKPSETKAVDTDASEVEDKAVAKKTTSRKRKS